MEDLIWDSVPAQRKRKAEKFSFPAITMSAIEKVGAGRKFSFNKAAQELLGIEGEDRVSFGFSTDRKIIAIRKTTGDTGLQLTKTCTISDKKTYDFIVKLLNLDISVENDFSIDTHNGLNVLNILNNVEIPQEEVIEFEVTNVGEVSEEEDLHADMTSIPTAESFGVEPAIEEEVEDSIDEELTVPQPEEDIDGTEEDVW
jgi:hypothetical protein